jgi:pilus assembly protein CpaB
MGRRTVLLIAALVVAALGTTLVFLYVNGVDDRAKANQTLVEVLVAKNLIPAGQSGQDALNAGSFEKKTISREAAAGDALGDSAGLLNLVAVSPILPGAQIQRPMFGATTTATNQLPLKAGELAMSISIGDPNRVAGFLTPGSNVAVFVTYTPKTGTTGVTTRILLPTVQVIATGNTTVQTTTTKDASGNPQTTQLPLALLTLAVTQKTLQKLVTAQAVGGTLYFGLLNKDSTISSNDQGTNLSNLFTP